MKRLTLLGMTLMLLSLVVSCSKEDDSYSITGKTQQEVFMMRTWKSTSWTDSTSSGTLETLSACEMDDTYTFTSKTKCLWKGNSNKCNSAEDAQAESEWSMSDPNGGKIMFQDIEWDILSLTANKIILRYFYETRTGETNTWRYTLEGQ